jgi:hypothetical protein
MVSKFLFKLDHSPELQPLRPGLGFMAYSKKKAKSQ